MARRKRGGRPTGDEDRSSSEVIAALRPELDRILASRREVRAALLYGSATEGRAFRDLDIALLVDRRASPPDRDLELALSVEDEVARSSDHPVEVRVVNDAPPALRYAVTRGVPLVVRSSEALADFKEQTWIEYFDFRPIALAYLREAR